jgi:hypothetical protein
MASVMGAPDLEARHARLATTNEWLWVQPLCGVWWELPPGVTVSGSRWNERSRLRHLVISSLATRA